MLRSRLLLAALVLAPALAPAATKRLSQDAVDQSWGPGSRVLSGVNVLMGGGDTVSFHDGTDLIQLQARGDLGALRVDTLQLATGAEPDTWLAGWGRDGAAYLWSYSRSGLTELPVEIAVDSPLNPGTALDPVDVQVGDGCAFGRFVDPADAKGRAFLYRLDLDGGSDALTAITSGDGARELVTSACQAAYVYDTGVRVSLRLYEGGSSSEIDVGNISQVAFRGGRLVYVKKTPEGASDVWLYDTTKAEPAPQRLSIDGRSSWPVTDGTYVAWLRRNVDGTYDLITRGNIPLVTYDRRPADPATVDGLAIQMDSGQLLWRDRVGRIQYDDGTKVEELPLGNIKRPVLQGGKIVYLGKFITENDNEAFLFDATPVNPSSNELPPPLRVTAIAGDQEFQLEWSEVIGADSYTVFIAEEPGVTREDYRRRYRGQKFDDKQSGVKITEILGDTMRQRLENQRTYYVTVSSKKGAIVGPSSREANATPGRPFELVPELGTVPQHALAADTLQPLEAYAGGGQDCSSSANVLGCDVFQSLDRAATFVNVTQAAPSMDPRAMLLGGDGVWVVSAGVSGKDVVYQSEDGQSWAPLLEVDANGTRKGIDQWVSRDGPNTFVAGLGPQGLSGIGLNAPVPGVKVTGIQVLGGTDTADLWMWGGGSATLLHFFTGTETWRCSSPACANQIAAPPGKEITAFRFDRERLPRAYAATEEGVFRSDDGFATWIPVNTGLPEQPAPVVNDIFIFDTGNSTKWYHDTVLLATDQGLFRSVDAGLHWTDHDIGLPEPAPEIFDLVWVGNEFGDQNMLLATDVGLYRADWKMPPPHSADIYLEYHCSPGQINDPQYRPGVVGQEMGCEAFVSNNGPATARDIELDLTFEGIYFDLKPDSFEVEQGYCEGWPTVRCYLPRLENRGAIAFGVTVIPRVACDDVGKDSFLMGANLVSHTSRDPLSDDNGFNIKVYVDPAPPMGGSGGSGGGTGGSGGTGAGGSGGAGEGGSGGTGAGGSGGTGAGGTGTFGGEGRGATSDPKGPGKGCGCTTSGDPASALLLALGVALGLRRRRR